MDDDCDKDSQTRLRTPLLAVDLVIERDGAIVLIRRENPPYEGCYALPGGFVEVGERVEDAAVREAWEETGLSVTLKRMIGIYSDPGRDPRGHVVSICFLACGEGSLRAGTDAREAAWFSNQSLPALAFDHALMIEDCLKNRTISLM
ncbi:MAG: ADP-ribose pyrophosphatase [Methanosaeta sp. PtaB.Bin039]|nr:MAG: ADP-ribose pyrophosphatase [Methanosaeta sp. PtaB.Bin039]